MKRAELKRKSPMQHTSIAASRPQTATTGILSVASVQRKARARKCAACREPFTPARPAMKVCSPSCAERHALALKAKAERKAARADRVATRAALDKFKSISTLKAEAQVIFNRFIRLRDEKAGHACICCGKLPQGAEALTGGSWDACHYKSRGSADHLRYNENNVHRGMKVCNTWGHTDYRGGLIKRIGLDAVEALESDQMIVKWTREMLEGIKYTYKQKIKEMSA